MRLSFNCPDFTDGTSWYRCAGPLAHLQKNFSNSFDIMPVGEINVPGAAFSDLAFFQRPATYKEVDAIRMFRRAGVPVIVDYDDNDLHVPSDFPSYQHFADPDVRNAMLHCMEIATAVTVTTHALREEIKKIFPHQRVYVVPNALDPQYHKAQNEPKTNTILWRGGSSHARDVWEVRGALQDFCQNHPDTFTFYGAYPWFLEDVIPGKQLNTERWQKSVPNYLAKLSEISPRFAIVPLCDNRFNRAKSNIAWLEMTWAGAVVLVPNWQEFDNPTAFTYSGQSDFLSRLEELVHLPDEVLEMMRKRSWNWIRKNRMLSQVNVLRSDIFFAATGRAEWPAEEEIESQSVDVIDTFQEKSCSDVADSLAVAHESGIAT